MSEALDHPDFNTLTSFQIKLIKQSIAVQDQRIIEDIADSEVFDYVRDRQELLNDEVDSFGREWISFNDAAEHCYDDWGVARALGYA